jgi:hypothetical protein
VSSQLSQDKEAVEDDDDAVNNDNVDDEVDHRVSFTIQPQNNDADIVNTYQRRRHYLSNRETHAQKCIKTSACELTTQKDPSFC